MQKNLKQSPLETEYPLDNGTSRHRQGGYRPMTAIRTQGKAPSTAAADTDGCAMRIHIPTIAMRPQAPSAPFGHTLVPPTVGSAPAGTATDTDRDAIRTHGQRTAAGSGHIAMRPQAPSAPFGHALVPPTVGSAPAGTADTDAECDRLLIHVPSPTGSNRRQFLRLATAGLPALRAAEPGFRFALIGDRTGTAAPQIYSRVWREVSLLGPDLAISIGDTIQGGNDATAVKEWRAMDDVWRRYRRFPTYFVPGNHDIWSAESKRLFEIEAGHPSSHSFVHGGALFIILDNSLTDALPPGQLEYCERALARHRDLRPKFVFCHRPSWLLDARVGNRNFGLHTLARKYGVDSVISGHGHQLVHLELDGVRYLEIGSSGGSIERGLRLGQGFKEGWFYHWIWAQVRDGKVEMTVKEATGQGRMFRLSDWGPTGPKFDPGDPALLDSPRL